jgi:ElaB/YqjD/DUF883 family membrane-anchored ribosome-binding protein
MFGESAHTEAMALELREVMSHAQKLVEATAGELDDRTRVARAKLEECLAQAKVKCGEFEGSLRDRMSDADKLIREKPYYAIGGSFVIGLLLGWLMSRK